MEAVVALVAAVVVLGTEVVAVLNAEAAVVSDTEVGAVLNAEAAAVSGTKEGAIFITEVWGYTAGKCRESQTWTGS